MALFLTSGLFKKFHKQALINISCKNINRKRRYKLRKFSQLILDHLVQHTIHFPINYHKLLLQAIQENPQQFINLLGEGGGGGAEPPTGGAAPPPPAATVHITPEEKAAIDRVRICRLVYFVTWINLVFGSFKWHNFILFLCEMLETCILALYRFKSQEITSMARGDQIAKFTYILIHLNTAQYT